MSRIVILAPLLPEARAVAQVLSIRGRFKGRVETSRDVAVLMVGIGAAHLQMVQELAPRAIILAGLAGGLSPALGLGDLVIDTPMMFPGLPVPLHCGKVHTSSQIVSDPQDKLAIHHSTGALAVDMENAPCRELAARMNVPFLTLRAISDTASDTLDPAFLRLIDDNGRPKPLRAISMLAKNPARLQSLLRIAKASKLALSHLGAGVKAVIDSGWPNTPIKGN